MAHAERLPGFDAHHTRRTALRRYGNALTADINDKGVLDVDTVKGCSAGMSARPGTGCYGCCYAASIAQFRGIDFGTAIARGVMGNAHARQIEKAVAAAPDGFFRVGTMGDPSHAWEHTVVIVEWLAPFATPVIVTKHWRVLTDAQIQRLVAVGSVLNTSVSALDTHAELTHRERQLARYADHGGVSVARIVSCDFNRASTAGASMAATQERLFTRWAPHTIDNPLRLPSNHRLVVDGVVLVAKVFDLHSIRLMSKVDANTHTGKCSDCTDKCGLSRQGDRAVNPQMSLFPGVHKSNG